MSAANSKKYSFGFGLRVLLIATLLLGFRMAASAAELVLARESVYPLAGHLEVLVDPAGSLTLANILAADAPKVFTPVSANINRGYTNDTVWIRTTLLRTASFPDDSFLRLWPPYLDHVDVYVQNKAAAEDPVSYQKYSVGDHTPVSARPVAAANIIVPLLIPENELRRVYIRIQTSSSLSFSGSIHTEADYIAAESYNVARNGGYVSIALVFSIINLLTFLRRRNRLYLYFSLYICALAVNDFAVSGFTTLFLPSLAHILSDYLVGFGVAAGLFFFSLFGMTLFDARIKSLLGSFFILLQGLSVLTGISLPLGLYSRVAPVLFFFSLASIFLLTGLSLRGVMNKAEGAIIYLTAFGVSNIGFTVHFLRVLGLLPLAWWNMNAVQVASVINMVLITLAMTERLHRSETLALQTALEAEQKAVERALHMTGALRKKQRDLEEALRAEREAIESQIRFVDIVSHEYRTPLAIIRTNLDIMEMKACQDKCLLSPNMEKIKRSLVRLTEILDVSLGKERLDRSKLQLTRLNVSGFVCEIVEGVAGLWEPRTFVYDCPSSEELQINGDRNLLKTAVINLLDNACKYSPEDTEIHISCCRDGHSAIIAVSDSGPGIDAADVDDLCRKNYRGMNSLKTRGTGMGLFIVRKIADLHGGQVEISSVQNITKISIILPLCESVQR